MGEVWTGLRQRSGERTPPRGKDTDLVWVRVGLRALTQLGTPPDLLLHTPGSPCNPSHGLPPRFWELHIPEHGGL